MNNKIVVKKVKHVAVSSSPPSAPSSSMPPSPPSTSSTRSTLSTASTASSLKTPSRVSKPFTGLRSTAPSPSSGRARGGRLSLKPIDPNADHIAALEKRIRTLRQATKYVSSDDDTHIAQLVHTWREAGREVTDRLFALLPKPAEEEQRGKSSWGWGWEDDGCDDFQPEPITKEQVQYVLDAKTNANGDPVDENGMPLFGEDIDDDMSKIIGKACSRSPRAVGMDMDIPYMDIEE